MVKHACSMRTIAPVGDTAEVRQVGRYQADSQRGAMVLVLAVLSRGNAVRMVNAGNTFTVTEWAARV